MAQVTTIADKTNQTPAFAMARRRCRMLVLVVRMTGLKVLVGNPVVIPGNNCGIVMLPQRMLAEWHCSREDTAPGEPQHHPSHHEEAK